MANLGNIQDIQVGVVTALLELQDNGFFDTLNRASSAVESFESNTNSGMSSLEKVSRVTGDIGTSLYRNVTVPAVQMGKSIVSAFEDTQSAFTGVRKTLNEEELIKQFGSLEKAYSTLDDAIWQMTQETGSSYESIAAVMEMAGQLNVPIGEAGKSLIDFTKNIIMLNDTTDLLGADAAKDLAQFMNIMGTSYDDVNNLGAAIVHLGNNSATTEADIVSMAMRLAGAGNSLGLTEQEVLAISATLESVGISAEMGGSAFSKAIKKMANSAVSYDKIIDLQNKTGMSLEELNILAQNDSRSFTALADSIGMGASDMKTLIKTGLQLQGFAEVSNMSMQEFANTIKNDPIKAIEAFIIGLGDTETKGKSTIEMLQDMGFTEVRLSDTLTRAALAQGELTRELGLANDAWSEGTALQDEADKRYQDLAVQISQLRETWKELQVDLAQFLVPLLKEVMEVLRGIIGFVKELPDPVKHILMTIAEVVTVAGPLLLIISKITGALSNLKTLFGGMMKIGILGNCHKLGDCMENTAENIGEVGKSFEKVSTGVGSVIKQLSGIIAIVGGVVLAVVNFVDMWRNGVNTINALLTVLGTALVGLGLFLTGLAGPKGIVVGAIVGGVLVAVAAIHEHWDGIVAWFKNLWNGVKEWWSNLWENIGTTVQNIAQSITDAWNGFVEWWQGLGESIKEIWDGICNFLFGGIEQVLSDIRGAINRWFYEHFGDDGLFSGIPAIIWSGLQLIVGFVQTVINLIHDILSGLFNILVDLFTGNFDKLMEDLKTLIFNIRADLSDISLDVYDFFVTVFNTVKEGFDKIVSSAKEFFGTIWNFFKEWIGKILSGVAEFFGNLVSSIVEHFNNLRDTIHNAFEAVSQVIQNIIDVIKGVFESFVEFISGVVENIKSIICSNISSRNNVIYKPIKLC